MNTEQHEETGWRLVCEIGQWLTAADVDVIAHQDYGMHVEEHRAAVNDLLSGRLRVRPFPEGLREVLTITTFGDAVMPGEGENAEPVLLRLLFASVALAVSNATPCAGAFSRNSLALAQNAVWCAEQLSDTHRRAELPGFFWELGMAWTNAEDVDGLCFLFAAILIAAIYGDAAADVETRCVRFVAQDEKLRDLDAFFGIAMSRWFDPRTGLYLANPDAGENGLFHEHDAKEILVWHYFVRRLIPRSPETPACNYVREQFEAAATKARLAECEPVQTPYWDKVVASEERARGRVNQGG